jgi:hypothetical protein
MIQYNREKKKYRKLEYLSKGSEDSFSSEEIIPFYYEKPLKRGRSSVQSGKLE